MALRRTISKRLFDGHRVAWSSVNQGDSRASPCQIVDPQNAFGFNFRREYVTSPDSAGKSFFRRILQRRAIYQSPARLPEFWSLPVGDKLREKIRGVNISEDRIRFDGLLPMVPDSDSVESPKGISVDDARKILKLAQVENLKAKLREIPESSISYSDFVRVCGEGSGNESLGPNFAKMMDESGNVIVFGNTVFLRPQQLAKSMETLISQSMAAPSGARFRELEQMERQKAIIDEKARSLVRGELYCGLGFLMIQTLGFMRLTFWELSWDVMEPICFFVTSFHFALGYIFFLRTSTEPSFEGYFQRRFEAKQRKLMERQNFDINRYYQLRKACFSN